MRGALARSRHCLKRDRRTNRAQQHGTCSSHDPALSGRPPTLSRKRIALAPLAGPAPSPPGCATCRRWRPRCWRSEAELERTFTKHQQQNPAASARGQGFAPRCFLSGACAVRRGAGGRRKEGYSSARLWLSPKVRGHAEMGAVSRRSHPFLVPPRQAGPIASAVTACVRFDLSSQMRPGCRGSGWSSLAAGGTPLSARAASRLPWRPRTLAPSFCIGPWNCRVLRSGRAPSRPAAAAAPQSTEGS